MSYLYFSSRISNFLIEKAKLNDEKKDILMYAIDVLFLNIMNISMVLFISYILGVVPGAIICVIVVTVVRMFAGGAHSNSPWRCALVTSFIFPFMAFLAQELKYIDNSIVGVFLFLSTIIGLIAVLTLAPIDSPNAPIISNKRRVKLKNYSTFSLIIIGIIALLIRYFLPDKIEIQLCISFAILWSSFILTNTGHIFFKIIDYLMIPKRREV